MRLQLTKAKTLISYLGLAFDLLIMAGFLALFLIYFTKDYAQRALTGEPSKLDIARGFETIRGSYVYRDEYRRSPPEDLRREHGRGHPAVNEYTGNKNPLVRTIPSD